MPAPVKQNLLDQPPLPPRIRRVVPDIRPLHHRILPGIDITSSPPPARRSPLTVRLLPRGVKPVLVEQGPTLQTRRVLVANCDPRVQHYQDAVHDDGAEGTVNGVFGQGENHRVVGLPIRALGGATVEDQADERQGGAEALV